jgi:hypothetical protein
MVAIFWMARKPEWKLWMAPEADEALRRLVMHLGLDRTGQIRLFGILKLMNCANCARAGNRAGLLLCAEHERQLGGGSPLSSLMVAKD